MFEQLAGEMPAGVVRVAESGIRTAADVPDLGVLLVGPMARGATVTLGEAR